MRSNRALEELLSRTPTSNGKGDRPAGRLAILAPLQSSLAGITCGILFIMKRIIRLKEQPIGLSDELTPPESYLLKTDGSLPAVAFKRVTTSEGFLDTGVPFSGDQPTTFVIGGSFVEGMYCDADRRFVAQLARRLPFNVLNAGYSGMTTLQLVTCVMNKIAGLSSPGDRILAFVPMSDINPLLQESGYWTSSKVYTPVQPPIESTRVASIEDLAALLAALKAFCDGMGLDLVVGTSPHRVSDFNSEGWVRNLFNRNSSQFMRARAKAYEIISQVRKSTIELGIPIIDLHAEFSDHPEWFYDEVHLNHVGHDRAAEFLSAKLS